MTMKTPRQTKIWSIEGEVDDACCPSVSRLRRSLTLPCDVNQIPLLTEMVDEVCEEIGLFADAMTINLALEEAVVNVMSYAYPPGQEGVVTIDAEVHDNLLTFTITDSGQPFDPTAQDNIDTTVPAEERSIGGLGIHLMRQCMDTIHYERRDGRNILILGKHTDQQDLLDF